MPKIKKSHFLKVFGLYLLNALTKNLKIKKVKEHFERAFQRCAKIYIRKKKFWGTKTIFDLGHLITLLKLDQNLKSDLTQFRKKRLKNIISSRFYKKKKTCIS